jgi:ABC-2 type transport system ATP-binding protein
MHEAEQLCDRVGIVHHGRLVGYGTPSELTTTSAADMRFSAAAELDVEKLARALDLTTSDVREVRPGEYVVDVAPSPRLVAALTTWLDDQDVLLSELRAGRGSLEDVFLRLTAEVQP